MWTAVQGWCAFNGCRSDGATVRARVTWQPFGRDFDLMLIQGVARPSLAGERGATGDLTAEISVTGGTEARVYFGLFNFDFNFDFNPASDTGLPMDLQFTLTTSISPWTYCCQNFRVQPL